MHAWAVYVQATAAAAVTWPRLEVVHLTGMLSHDNDDL
jgi:hypothetical protein